MKEGMFREPRYIRGTKTTSVPKRLVSISCDYQLVNVSSCGQYGKMEYVRSAVLNYPGRLRQDVVYGNVSIESAIVTVETLRLLVAGKTNPWIVSQNLGRDLTLIGFWDEVTAGRFKWVKQTVDTVETTCYGTGPVRQQRGLLVTNDPPVIIVGWWNGHKVIMVDTRNFGAEQLIDEYPCQDRARNALEFMRGLCDWVKHNDLGKLRYTASGMAYEAFKHRFMSHKICPHGNKEACKLERAAYFGGRSSLFRYGNVKGKVYKLDVQGLFPSVMMDNLFPVQCNEMSLMNGGTLTADILSASIARVKVDTETSEYPVRDSETGKVYYAQGKYLSYLCGDELLCAVCESDVRHMGLVCTYKLERIFTAYVDFFWQMRMQSREYGLDESENLAKAMLVGLYGKFGQKSLRWKDRPSELSPIEWGHWWKHGPGEKRPELFRSVGYNTQQIEEGGETAESFPAVSAFVTMYARSRMDELREIAGPRHVYAQVIDCLFTDTDGFKRLMDSGEVMPDTLGKLALKGEANGATFYSPGDYSFGGECKVSGVSITGEATQDNSYISKEETRLNGILAGYPGRGISVREVIKHMRREPPRQGIDADGWVRPTRLEQ